MTSMENLARAATTPSELAIESAVKADLRRIANAHAPTRTGDWPGAREREAHKRLMRTVGLSMLLDGMEEDDCKELVKATVRADAAIYSDDADAAFSLGGELYGISDDIEHRLNGISEDAA